MAPPVTTFISSTYLDNVERRRRVEEAVIHAGLVPVGMERFVPGSLPTVTDCERMARECDVYVGIIAHRYGWVPDGHDRSITEIEYDAAKAAGRDRLVFEIDPEVPIQQSQDFDAGPDRWQKQEKLETFRAKFRADQRPGLFTNDSLQGRVLHALTEWRERRGLTIAPIAPPRSPERYLQALREATGHIDIRGLAVASGTAHRFPIDELYVELSAAGAGAGKGGREPERTRLLRDTLAEPRLVIVGDPGSGKTTFLRWIAWLLAGDRLAGTQQARERLGLDAPLVPILLPIAELLERMRQAERQNLCPRPNFRDSPEWLPYCLGEHAAVHGLDAAWFEGKLEAGETLLLLDGLDEAPDRAEREHVVRLIEAVARTWTDTRIVVTSRPAAYTGMTIVPGFTMTQLESLDDAAVENFLGRWSEALLHGDTAKATAHRDDLLGAVRSRPAIRRLARNTVMLTALAVLHWNERRLPEQRAELYQSILGWLARSREARPGRASPERTLEVLRELAFAMYRHADAGRCRCRGAGPPRPSRPASGPATTASACSGRSASSRRRRSTAASSCAAASTSCASGT